jgi:hypothetical protein
MHKRTKHENKLYECAEEGCEKSYASTQSLRIHQKSKHNNDIRRMVEHCCLAPKCQNKNFQSKQNLNKHIESYHTGHIYVCQYDACIYTFSDQSNLYRHERICHKDVRDKSWIESFHNKIDTVCPLWICVVCHKEGFQKSFCPLETFKSNKVTKEAMQKYPSVFDDVFKINYLISSPRCIDNNSKMWIESGALLKDAAGNYKIDDSNESHQTKTIFSGKLINTGHFICHTCSKSLKTGRYPKASIANGNYFEDVPCELKELTTLENRILSPRIPFMWIRRLQGSLMPSIKGCLTCIPADVVTSVEGLPTCNDEDETVRAELKKKLENKTVLHSENIRPNLIEHAARILVNKPLYAKEGISLINEKLSNISHIQKLIDEILPEDGDKDSSTTFKKYGGASVVNDEIITLDSKVAKETFKQFEVEVEDCIMKKSSKFSKIRYSIESLADEVRKFQGSAADKQFLMLEEDIIKILTDLDGIKENHLRSECYHLIQKVNKLADLLEKIAFVNTNHDNSNRDEPTEETEQAKIFEKAKISYDNTDSESDDEEDNEVNLPRDTESLLIPGTKYLILNSLLQKD